MTPSEQIDQLQKAVMQLQAGAIYNQALLIELMEYVAKLERRIFGDPPLRADEPERQELVLVRGRGAAVDM